MHHAQPGYIYTVAGGVSKAVSAPSPLALPENAAIGDIGWLPNILFDCFIESFTINGGFAPSFAVDGAVLADIATAAATGLMAAAMKAESLRKTPSCTACGSTARARLCFSAEVVGDVDDAPLKVRWPVGTQLFLYGLGR